MQQIHTKCTQVVSNISWLISHDEYILHATVISTYIVWMHKSKKKNKKKKKNIKKDIYIYIYIYIIYIYSHTVCHLCYLLTVIIDPYCAYQNTVCVKSIIY